MSDAANGTNGAMMERVVAMGDLEGLQPMERAKYYTRVCESVGLNPLTKPFSYIKLNGKLTLYALRDASDQLRKIHEVSVRITKRERSEDLCIVTAQATMPSGRVDESIGAVNLAGLKGENLANALMKAETKAKRRVTLSICGLGWLDETEISSIPSAKPVTVTADGEIIEEKLIKQLEASVDWDKWAARHLDTLRKAAEVDMGALNEAWFDVNEDIKKTKPPSQFVEALKLGKDELKTSAKKVPS